MDISLVTSLIGTLGFPIVCVVGMAWYMVKRDKEHKEEVQNIMDKYEKSTADMTFALNNNTVVLERILEHLPSARVNEK